MKEQDLLENHFHCCCNFQFYTLQRKWFCCSHFGYRVACQILGSKKVSLAASEGEQGPESKFPSMDPA